MRQLRFVGTGSGKVTSNRFHSSVILSSENYNLLIDCGDGIPKALLQQNIGFESVNGIIFTHLHPDHFSGLPALIVQMKLYRRKSPLDIFIHEELKDTVLKFLHNSYLFEEKFGFEFNLRTFKDEMEIPVSGDFIFTARRNSHLEPYKIFDKTGEVKFISLSFLFNICKKNLYYSGDIGSSADLNLFGDKYFETAVCETTHVTVEDIQNLFEKPSLIRLYLTHIDELNLKTLRQMCEKLTGGTKQCFLAFDGLSANF